MNVKYDKKIEEIRSEFRKEQSKFKKDQQQKFRRFVVFSIALCLVLSGITGAASYSLAAGSVSYTAKDTSWEVENTQDAIDELYSSVGSSLVGSVYSYMGTSAPFGYLACDGSVYNVADYPRLANHINKNFGSYNYFGGNGTTTFAVPDLRGEFLRGTGTNSHTTQGNGAAVGIHQDGTTIPHIYIGGSSIVGLPNNYPANQDNINYVSTAKVLGAGATGSVTTNNKTYTTRPTNTSVLYIIKY